jgi:uncharacterized protein YjiK
MKNLFFLLMILLLVGCDNPPKAPKIKQKMPFYFQYNLTKPTKTYELPSVLKEISGLSFNAKNELACIQDEDGFVFMYDLDKAEIIDKILFRKTGDYEAIEFVDNLVYVLKSNGIIYEIANLGMEKQTVTTYETALNKENDTEGLSYDAKSHCLLIACKENAGLNGAVIKNQKSVFSFDLSTKKLIKTPLLTITDEAITQFFKTSNLKNLPFDINKNIRFKPSGIAIKNGFYYIIASIGNMMIVVDKNSEIQHIELLNKKYLPKPEGITFDRNGVLYLASEGDKGNGLIQVFQ